MALENAPNLNKRKVFIIKKNASLTINARLRYLISGVGHLLIIANCYKFLL